MNKLMLLNKTAKILILIYLLFNFVLINWNMFLYILLLVKPINKMY